MANRTRNFSSLCTFNPRSPMQKDEVRFYEMGRYLIRNALVAFYIYSQDTRSLHIKYLHCINESGQQFSTFFSLTLILEDTHISSISLSSCLLP